MNDWSLALMLIREDILGITDFAEDLIGKWAGGRGMRVKGVSRVNRKMIMILV